VRIKLLFASIFIILTFYLSRLQLFVDDYLFFYNSPRLVDNLFIFFQQYTLEFGIYRPVAVFLYHFLFSLYQYSPAIAHLLPLAFQILSGYLLYRILINQKISSSLSLLLALIFTLHPFAAEQYMWLAASQGALSSLLFIIQILVIQNSKNFNKTLFCLFIFSLLSIFTYESTFFLFIPLIYLAYHHFKHSFQKISLAILAPYPLYLISKLAFKPQNPRPLINSFSELIHNSSELFKNLFNVNFNSYYQTNFWNSYSLNGYLDLLSKPYLLIIFIFFIAALLFILATNPKNISKPDNKVIIFWGLTFLFSLPPLVLNQFFYFGFRALFLPIITGIIFLSLVLDRILETNMHRLMSLFCFVLIFICTLTTINFSLKLEKLSQEDLRLANKIAQIAPANTTIFLKSEIPLDSRHTFLHADHLLSCFFYEWSAPACLKSQGITNNIIVKDFDKAQVNSPIIHLLYKSDHSLVIEEP